MGGGGWWIVKKGRVDGERGEERNGSELWRKIEGLVRGKKEEKRKRQKERERR